MNITYATLKTRYVKMNAEFNKVKQDIARVNWVNEKLKTYLS